MGIKRLSLMLIALLILLTDCQSDVIADDDNTVMIAIGVFSQESSRSLPHISNLVGYDYVESNLDDVLSIANNSNLDLSPTDLPYSPYGYEAIAVHSKSEYRSAQKNNDNIKDIDTIVSFAYSYETKKVYLVNDDGTFCINNPEESRLDIQKLFLNNGFNNNYKFRWNKNDASRETVINNSIKLSYSISSFFRYEQYFVPDGEKLMYDDFISSDACFENHLQNLDQALKCIYSSLGCSQANAYVSYDVFTNNLLIYYWSDIKNFCIILDGEYKIIETFEIPISERT